MSDLYIATYSAHASVLESLADGCVVKKMLIDAGGLKMPNGSFSNPDLFNNYVAVTEKTLHAKIILKDDGGKSVLSLWTGNLRRSTIEDANLFFNLAISNTCKDDLIEWFEKDKKRKNLFFYTDGSGKKVNKIYPLKDTFWKELSKAMPPPEEIQHIYAFAPWGSHEFIDALSTKTDAMSLYTRRELGVWADYAFSKGILDANVYKAKESAPFPHFKAIFITNENEDLIWSYIGSANFTHSAMFSNNNIEYGLIFPSKKSNDEIKELFDTLKDEKFGWENIPKSKADSNKKTDEDYDDVGEYCNQKNFQERKNAHILFSDLRFSEKFLEKIYSNGKISNIKGLKINVENVDDYCFHLVITNKDGSKWSMDVPRVQTKSHMVFSDAKIEECFADILKKPKYDPPKGGNKTPPNNDRRPGIKDTSILIPMEDLINNEAYLEKVKKALKVLYDGRKFMKDKKKYENVLKLLNVWKPVVDRL